MSRISSMSRAVFVVHHYIVPADYGPHLRKTRGIVVLRISAKVRENVGE
jgi:hypothetical protein